MYKIGDKVEYYGKVETITKIFRDGFIELDNILLVHPEQLKPYRTAHEKLIEMGYEEKIHDVCVKREVENGKYKQYVNGSEVILIDIKDREFTTYTLYNGSKGISDVSWVSYELSHILTQYLEELEESR